MPGKYQPIQLIHYQLFNFDYFSFIQLFQAYNITFISMQLTQFSWIGKAWNSITTILSTVFSIGSQALIREGAIQTQKLTDSKQSQVEKMEPLLNFPKPQHNPFSKNENNKPKVLTLQQLSKHKGRYLKNWLQQNQKAKKKQQQKNRQLRFYQYRKEQQLRSRARDQKQNGMKDQNQLRQLEYLRKFQYSLQKSKIQFLNKSKSEFDRFDFESKEDASQKYSDKLSLNGKTKKKQKGNKMSFKQYLKSGRKDISPNGLFKDMKGDDISSIERHTQMMQESEPELVKFAKIPSTPVKTVDDASQYARQKPQKKGCRVDPDLKFMIEYHLEQYGLTTAQAFRGDYATRQKVNKITQQTLAQHAKYLKMKQRYNNKFDDSFYQSSSQSQSQSQEKHKQKQKKLSGQKSTTTNFNPIVNWKRVLQDQQQSHHSQSQSQLQSQPEGENKQKNQIQNIRTGKAFRFIQESFSNKNNNINKKQTQYNRINKGFTNWNQYKMRNRYQ